MRQKRQNPVFFGIFLYFQPMIQLGQTILCINNRTLRTDILCCPLLIGSDYRVQALRQCRCGAIFVDVGISLDRERFQVICGCQVVYDDGIWWFDVKRFRPATADVFLWEKEEIGFEQLRLN
jgi:hypothetical protein